jgi:hypothetical protein
MNPAIDNMPIRVYAAMGNVLGGAEIKKLVKLNVAKVARSVFKPKNHLR